MIAIGILMQTGSAVSVVVIRSVGIVEALWLRTFIAAVVLVAVRPRFLRLPAPRDRLVIAGLTLALLAMNLCFFQAISRAPVGIVVAVEFLGPLGVAISGTRRPLDALWVALAGAGVAVLGGPSGSTSLAGIGFALASAVCWAAFLLLAKQAVGRMEPFRATMLMLVGSSIILTPLLLLTGFKFAGQGRAILLGFAVALLSSALPYVLELVALQRVCASTYGILLSLEPAVAALMGFAILGQHLSWPEIGAVGAVVAAAAGASGTAVRSASRAVETEGGG